MNPEERDGDLTRQPQDSEKALERSLRPTTFQEYIGQTQVMANLETFVHSARREERTLDHCLLFAPPGLGKTTLAHIVAHEMEVNLHISSGPAIDKKGTLAGLLTNLARGDVLFIDEIHRLTPAVEEALYTALEDFEFDIIIGEGAHAKSVKLPLQRFTLVGATTRKGMLQKAFQDRFGIQLRLDYYEPKDLTEIVRRSADIMSIGLNDDSAKEIARRSRGTPRIANRLLRRVYDFAVVQQKSGIDREIARYALNQLGIDDAGLDELDRRILQTLVVDGNGGPLGIKTLSAILGEEAETVEDVYEPYLIQQGYLQRTSRGRIATPKAYKHLGTKLPRGHQASLDLEENND